MKMTSQKRRVFSMVGVCCATLLVVCSLALLSRHPSDLLTTPIFSLPEVGLNGNDYFLALEYNPYCSTTRKK